MNPEVGCVESSKRTFWIRKAVRFEDSMHPTRLNANEFLFIE